MTRVDCFFFLIHFFLWREYYWRGHSFQTQWFSEDRPGCREFNVEGVWQILHLNVHIQGFLGFFFFFLHLPHLYALKCILILVLHPCYVQDSSWSHSKPTIFKSELTLHHQRAMHCEKDKYSKSRCYINTLFSCWMGPCHPLVVYLRQRRDINPSKISWNARFKHLV